MTHRAEATPGHPLPGPEHHRPFRLVASELACRRGGRLIFGGVDLTLGPGSLVELTGRNGAGKSTLLALIAGRLEAAAGTLVFEGPDEASLSESLHLVGHRDGLKTALTAAENLRFAGELLGGSGMPPAQALAAVGIAHAESVPVAWLSAGQRRRVALARLLVASRPIWLLDEPLAALDLASQRLLVALIETHLARGGAVLAATHAPLGLAHAGSLELGA